MLLISRKAINCILKQLQTVLVPKYYYSFAKIGGNGIIVEVDESKFGKRKYERGHRVEGVWIIGAVGRTNARRIFLKSVENRSANTLCSLLVCAINQESTIYSDCFKSYSKLNSYFANHLTVNHSLNFVDSENGVHTNTIEGNWAGVKRCTPVRSRSLISIYSVRYMIKRQSRDPHNIVLEYFSTIL